MFSNLAKTNSNFFVKSILSSADAFNLDLFEILSSGKESNSDAILDGSILSRIEYNSTLSQTSS